MIPKLDPLYVDLLHKIAHDVRGPIRGMTEMASILEHDYGVKFDAQGREYLSVMLDCGRKAQRMMDGLIQYVKIAQSDEGLAPTAVAPLVGEVLKVLSGLVSDKSAEIDVGPLPTVRGHSTQLQLLFRCLFENALTFNASDRKPDIRLEARRLENIWEFCLTDNGIGIDPKHVPRIFELFQKLHTDEEYAGAGVGLALARQIVLRHGGTLRYAPHVPVGSAFYFTLVAGE